MTFLRQFAFCAALIPLSAAASAADMPMVEDADTYVRICDALGAGYYYIPGSDTCLKLSGYVRAEMHYVDGDPDVLIGEGKNSEFNNWTSRVRGRVAFESETATDFGQVRTTIAMEATRGPVDYVEDYPVDFDMPYAFIQIENDHGTFTAGHTDSFFDFFSSDDYGTRIDIDDNTTSTNLFAYTLAGPNGLSATLSAEDPDSSGRRYAGEDDYEGLQMPDFIGNLRADQEWGSAQLMGAARHIHDEEGSRSGDGFGWAIGGGASLNLPHDALFSTQVGYADGALGYITNDPGGVGDFARPDGDETNQAWMGRGGLFMPFTDTVSAWFDGSFTHAEDDANDDEYDFWAFVVGAAWTPNDNLTMGPEFGFNRIDGDDPGEDGDLWGVMWRLESAF